VNAKTSARVLRAAQEVSYHQRRSHGRRDVLRSLNDAAIGVLSLGMDRSLMALPVIAGAIGGAEEALSEAGAAVQLVHVPDLENPPAGLTRQRFDGVILTGALQGNLLGNMRCALFDRLRELPTVWLLGCPKGCWGDTIASNDYLTGSLAAEQLV